MQRMFFGKNNKEVVKIAKAASIQLEALKNLTTAWVMYFRFF